MRQETSTHNLSTKAAGDYNKKREEQNVTEESLGTTCCKMIPQIVFFSLLAFIVGMCIFDLKLVLRLFN